MTDENPLAALLARMESELGAAPAPSAAAEPRAPRDRFVVFLLGVERYAFPLANVIEISTPPPVTRIPHLPPWVLGVANLRGEILVSLDLARFLDIEAGAEPARQRLLIVRHGDAGLTAGFAVDAVEGITTLAAASAAVPALPGRAAAFLTGVVERTGELITVLDPGAVLDSAEVRRLREE